MDVDFGTCHLDALEHEQYPEYRSVQTSRVREEYVGNQEGLVLLNAAAEGSFNRIGIFGTHALVENWFEDAVHQIARITYIQYSFVSLMLNSPLTTRGQMHTEGSSSSDWAISSLWVGRTVA